jgi:ribosomal-protein-alanine N-acetyltransferase
MGRICAARIARLPGAQFEPSWPARRADPCAALQRRRLRALRRSIGAPTRATAFCSSAARIDALLGGIGLSNVRRGVAETGSLGYWIGERYARQRLS